jgi:hypothetical protein
MAVVWTVDDVDVLFTNSSGVRLPRLECSRTELYSSCQSSIATFASRRFLNPCALVPSLELRIPLVRDGFDRPVLELAPFVDFGRGWNRERGGSLRTIASAGLGLRRAPSRWRYELYRGARLRDVDRRDAEGFRDMGVHARVEPLSI